LEVAKKSQSPNCTKARHDGLVENKPDEKKGKLGITKESEIST